MSENKKNANKYRNNKGKNKKKDWEESTDFKENEKSRGANDVSWYVPDAAMLRDAASFPWLYQMGQAIRRNGAHQVASNDAIPGIAMMPLMLCYGVSDDPTSALNASAQAIYTYVRHANSGSKNYGMTDLMLYIMSLDSIYYMISWITRVYATVNMYSMENKYLPLALMQMEHIDVESIRKDMPGFRARINNLIMKVANLVIPNTMPIFQRHSFLFNNYYMEGQSIRDQVYFFTPVNYYTFGFDAQGAGQLQPQTVSGLEVGGVITADALINCIASMVDKIYMEEDFGIMAGDILKAYGENGIQKIGLLPDGIVAQPVYNYSVLTQFRNAVPCPRGTLFGVDQVIPSGRTSPYLKTGQPTLTNYRWGHNLTTGVDFIGTFNPASTSWTGNNDWANYKLADEASAPLWVFSDNWEVGPEEVMVGTRLAPYFSWAYESGVFKITDVTFGTEIPCGVTYGRYAYTNANVLSLETITLYRWNAIDSEVDGPSSPAGSTLIDILAFIAPFKFRPLHTIVTYGGQEAAGSLKGYSFSELPITNVDNYAVIDFTHMKRLNDVALLGEFAVPRLAVSQ